MKRTFTFIAACFVFASLFGQTEKSNIGANDKILNLKSKIPALENPEGRSSILYLFYGQSLTNHQPSVFKSAQTLKQRMDSVVSEETDEFTGQIGLSYKDEYIYNTAGKLTQEINYSWDTNTGKWVIDWKSELSYNSEGNLIQEISYSLDENTGLLVADEKYTYIYDSAGKKTQDIFYMWDESTSQWAASYKSDYTYNSAEKITQYISYWWDGSSSLWIISGKQEFFYNPDGIVNRFNGYMWDENSSQWNESWKSEYVYNSSKKRISETSYSWDPLTGQMVGNEKYEVTYDSNGNASQEIDYVWDENTSQWVIDRKNQYTYDNSYTFDELLLPYYFEDTNFYFEHKLTGQVESTLNTETGLWEISAKTTFYYSQQDVNSTVHDLKADLRIYPNPFTDGFRISGLGEVSTIQLFDINARLWFTKDVVNNEFVPAETLPQGIYLLKIKTSKGSAVKKLVR